MSLNNGKSMTASATEDISISGNEEGIDLDGKAILQPNLSEEDIEKQKKMEEYKEELLKIQEDIATLRLVLNDKVKRENELKTLMGVSFVDEIKQDFVEGLTSIKQTTAFQKAAQTFTDLGASVAQNDAYQKTSEGFKSAAQKITPSISSIGTSMKSGLGNFRNSSMFKSFETGISSTFSSNKMKNSQSEFSVDEGLGRGSSTMPTSKSTLGTPSMHSNGVAKHEAILED